MVCVRSLGNLLNFHRLPRMRLAPIEEPSRQRVLGMLRRKGLLSPERIKLIRSWEHLGFNVNASERIVAADVTGRENLAHSVLNEQDPR